MKKIFAMTLLAALPLAAMAQYEEGSENGVVSLAGREGFSIQTKKADFVFKPYLLVQTAAHITGTTTKGWTRLTTKTTWPIQGLPCRTPYSDSLERRGQGFV